LAPFSPFHRDPSLLHVRDPHSGEQLCPLRVSAGLLVLFLLNLPPCGRVMAILSYACRAQSPLFFFSDGPHVPVRDGACSLMSLFSQFPSLPPAVSAPRRTLRLPALGTLMAASSVFPGPACPAARPSRRSEKALFRCPPPFPLPFAVEIVETSRPQRGPRYFPLCAPFIASRLSMAAEFKAARPPPPFFFPEGVDIGVSVTSLVPAGSDCCPLFFFVFFFGRLFCCRLRNEHSLPGGFFYPAHGNWFHEMNSPFPLLCSMRREFPPGPRFLLFGVKVSLRW